jgi:hypothetical protein
MTITPIRYALDSNIFIEANRRYYAFDLCPGFWKCVLHYHAASRIQSIDRIRTELAKGRDKLADWVSDRVSATIFHPSTTPDVLHWFAQMVTWVQSQPQFFPAAKAEFAANADSWLIAYAKANNMMLVTHEEWNREARRRVPIPNVCQAFGVPYTDTFVMLRDLAVSFTWNGVP